MKRSKFFRLAGMTLAFLSLCGNVNADEQKRDTLTLFDDVTFYDGYLVENNPEDPTLDGILRHRTSLYAVKMTDAQLNQIGDSLEMHVSVRACCDNYDRIGNVNIALVHKGQETYKPDDVSRIEIGRFITPFMNKNKKPDTVPYEYKIPYLSYLFRDKSLREKYDFWVEYELFGVPYAANQEISGCAGRSDVFKGTLKFSTLKTNQGVETDNDVLVPIVIKNPEYIAHNLNNYNENATDTIGKTTKTYTFEVPKDVESGILVVVTSNHGANQGGEEYNRRWHYIYVDDELALTYKPGRKTCEPFRKYNTCPNGIYGYFPMKESTWQSFSNWCPGDVIDNRIIGLGAFKAGTHTVRISVPDAKFVGGQGDIPVSIFFQGLTKGEITGILELKKDATTPQLSLTVYGKVLTANSSEGVVTMELRDLQGKLICENECSKTLNISSVPGGIYLVSVELTNGIIVTKKIKL